MSLGLRFAGASRKGLTHAHNEDVWAHYALPAGASGGLFVICDGVSTTGAGAEAAALVAARLGQFCELRGPRLMGHLVQLVSEIDWEMRGSPHKLACTLSTAWFEEDQAYLLSIGDSPVYRLRGRRLRQVGAETTGSFRRLRAYMGMGPKITDQLACEQWSVAPGDVYFLMSDGITEVLDEDELLDLWWQDPTPSVFVEAALAAVVEARGEDDATLIAVQAL